MGVGPLAWTANKCEDWNVAASTGHPR